jgi:hypothetical protein
MIISASRRTDIPAFYADWFMNRIREGFCLVQNPDPRSLNQVSNVSLLREDVDVIVFWTRFPLPLMKYLQELDDRGFKYYFHYTVMNNPRWLDPKSPSLAKVIDTFRRIADRIGPERMIWRYDPLVFSKKTNIDFHIENYSLITGKLKGYSSRSVISLVDQMIRSANRMKALDNAGAEFFSPDEQDLSTLISSLVQISGEAGMEITSCAEDLSSLGVRPGKCIDDEYILKTFGVKVSGAKHSQREKCGCVVSKDIGAYETCIFGCQYCYATKDFDLAQKNYKNILPNAPSLSG